MGHPSPETQVLAGQVEEGAALHTNWTAAWRRFGWLPEMFDVGMENRHPTETGGSLAAWWWLAACAAGSGGSAQPPASAFCGTCACTLTDISSTPATLTQDVLHALAGYPLRPELMESTFLLHAATGSPRLLTTGAALHARLRDANRVACGYASVGDVSTGQLEVRRARLLGPVLRERPRGGQWRPRGPHGAGPSRQSPSSGHAG